jgi:hemolysin activation/secretion protein
MNSDVSGVALGHARSRIGQGLILGLCAIPVGASGEPQPAAAQSAAAPVHHFDILEYVVDGNTVLPVPEIEEAVYPYLGESRTADDVDKARKALEDVYQKHGFQTVQVSIPQQGVDTGIVHLQVAENPVGRLRVVDAKYHLPSEIKQSAPSMAEGTVSNYNDVQKDVVALNQQASMKVTPAFKPGTAPGTVDVDLKVEDSPPWHASLEVNNQNNQDTTPLRVVGSVSYDNLWQLGHSISLTYLLAPEDPSNAKVLSGTYLFPLPDTQISFLLYGVKSDSNVAALAGTDVIGRGDIEGLRAILPLPGSNDFFQSLTVGIDRKDLAQNVVTLGAPSNAPVLYYPITLAYHAGLTEGEAQTLFDASFNFAVPGLGSDSTKVDPQRYNASRQYFYFRAAASRVQPLFDGITLFAKLGGQMTGDPLLSGEQLSAGGVNSVRGYLEAERIGDYGFTGTLEVRSPSFANLVSPKINDWRVHAFFDGGGLWIRDPLVGEQSSFSLYGIGVGSRVTAFDDVKAAVDIAFPLTKGATTKAGDMRVHFRVSSGF